MVSHARLTNYYILWGENRPECQVRHSPSTIKQIL